MAIRQFEKGDTERAIRVWADACEDSHAFLPATFLRETERSLREGLLAPDHTLVFDRDGVRGFITAAHGQVVSLFVEPPSQRQGAGTALLSHAKNQFEALDLAVFVDNASGIRFYHQQGFIVVERKLFPPAGCEVLIMKWSRIGRRAT